MPIRKLSPSLEHKARKELNEKPEEVEREISTLKEWLKKQPHLVTRQDDQHLLTFLRSTKHNMDAAKRKIDAFYTIRAAMPDFFGNRVPNDPKIQQMLKLGVTLLLPKPLAEDGPRICLIRSSVPDPGKHTVQDVNRPVIYMHDIAFVNDDNMSVAGCVYVIDMADVTMQHLFQMNASMTKKFALYLTDGFPLNVQAHYINLSSALETAFNLFKSFFPEEQRNKIHVHKNLEDLYKYVPKQCLPKEYGGENGSVADIVQHWEKQFSEYEKFLMDERNYGVRENLRPANSVYSGKYIAEADTPFKRLDVD